MSELLEKILDNDVEGIKEGVSEHKPNLKKLMRMEREGEAREHVLDWLEGKKERIDMITDDDRLEEMLSHLEYAYRTAAISEETYQRAREINRRLMGRTRNA